MQKDMTKPTNKDCRIKDIKTERKRQTVKLENLKPKTPSKQIEKLIRDQDVLTNELEEQIIDLKVLTKDQNSLKKHKEKRIVYSNKSERIYYSVFK